ncbi:MAG: hypothetical protein ACLTBV_32915 [Enterocloster bolteae]
MARGKVNSLTPASAGAAPLSGTGRHTRGYFPDTAAGLEQERFCLVSLDADLYAPILSGLVFSTASSPCRHAVLLHDYNNERFRGARQAVEEFEKQYGRLCLVPLCDLHGSAVIVKPCD